MDASTTQTRRTINSKEFDVMSANQSEISIAVADKLKRYLDIQNREQEISRINEVDLKAYCKNYSNYKNDYNKSKGEILAREVRRMQSSMKQLTERELAAKRRLEMQMSSGGNSPFIVSPYACPIADEKRTHKSTKKKIPNKRILSVNRTSSAPRGNRQHGSSPTKAERERILDLTAKLLVATETVALPKNRNQSRESQTAAQEYFPSLPAACRAKSSYSDPGVHTLTKERVDKLNSPISRSSKQSKDQFSCVDSGSLKSQRTPFHVENCNRGYVIRKKPASYPSSLASQNSRFVSPQARALANNFTVIKDKNEELESLDDDYFDHEFPEVNRTAFNSAWLEGTGEKQHADTSTQTIQNRGTQTSKHLSEQESADEYIKDNIQSSHAQTNTSSQIQQFEGLSENSLNEVAESVDGGRIMSIKTQTNFEPRVITYQVYVLTGDIAGSSTKSDVKINIFGEYGDSGDRSLLKSKTSKEPFKRGQIDVFDLDCKNLGKLSNIRIGHNGTTSDAGWYLSKIHIRAGQNAKKAYTFSCYKWLSAKEGDGQIMRDVTLAEAIPVNELPAILPRKTMMRKGSSEESEMSDNLKLKYLKTKATRDKKSKQVPNNKSRDKKKASDQSSGSHKSAKLHRVISSTSEDSLSSSTDTDIDKTIKKYQQEKRSSKHSEGKTEHRHESPKANKSGRVTEKAVDSITSKTSNIELDTSTDTSVSSVISSPYTNKSSDSTKVSPKKSKKSSKSNTDRTSDKKKSLISEKENLSDLQSPKRRTRKRSDGDKTLQKSSDSDKVIRKISKKENNKKTKKVSRTDDVKSKELVTESPLHSENISVTESVIVPQEAEMLHGTYDHTIKMSPLKSQASSLDSSEETNQNNNEESEEEQENVEFSLKDTKKQYTESPNEDELYMAGFRAGMTATKDKHKDKGSEENESVQEKVRSGPTIHQASEDGDLDRVKELVESIPDLKNKVDERGWAPIHISAAFGHLDVLKWLTISGVNLSEETNTGYTAIHLAAMNGHVNCIMILSAMGCSISCRTVDQFTPLHLAAMSGHIECLKWLLSNRAKIDAKDANDRTPLDLAEQFQHKDCEKLLHIFGKELKRKDSVMTLLRDPNALRKNSTDVGSEESENNSEEEDEDEDKGWISDAEDVSNVVGRGGDDRPADQRRASMQAGRRASVIDGILPPRPKLAQRRMSKLEERQELQLEEKKRNFEQQKRKIQRKNSSFLDSIRQEIEDGSDEGDEFD